MLPEMAMPSGDSVRALTLLAVIAADPSPGAFPRCSAVKVVGAVSLAPAAQGL